MTGYMAPSNWDTEADTPHPKYWMAGTHVDSLQWQRLCCMSSQIELSLYYVAALDVEMHRVTRWWPLVGLSLGMNGRQCHV